MKKGNEKDKDGDLVRVKQGTHKYKTNGIVEVTAKFYYGKNKTKPGIGVVEGKMTDTLKDKIYCDKTQLEFFKWDEDKDGYHEINASYVRKCTPSQISYTVSGYNGMDREHAKWLSERINKTPAAADILETTKE